MVAVADQNGDSGMAHMTPKSNILGKTEMQCRDDFQGMQLRISLEIKNMQP